MCLNKNEWILRANVFTWELHLNTYLSVFWWPHCHDHLPRLNHWHPSCLWCDGNVCFSGWTYVSSLHGHSSHVVWNLCEAKRSKSTFVVNLESIVLFANYIQWTLHHIYPLPFSYMNPSWTFNWQYWKLFSCMEIRARGLCHYIAVWATILFVQILFFP